MKESHEIPLYFYVNGNDFIFGNVARDRFSRHDPNAYGNYFEIIKDPGKHFSIYGNKKPIKQLFYYGIEQYLSYFLNSVLYKVDSIESYRQHFPLRFLFDTDIDDHEKSLIELLFQEAGYYNLDRVLFNQQLFEVLAQKAILPKDKAILLLNGIDDVLYLKLYKNLNAEAIGFFKLSGQGADPRVKILADMIVEYIMVQNSYLAIDKDAEITFLLPFCVGLLENTSQIIMGDAELSDGNSFWFKVNERNLNDRLQYYSNDVMVYTVIDDLLKSGGLLVDDVVILLGTEEISTSYFLNKLQKRYHHVKEVNAVDIKDAMKSVFSMIAASDYRIQPKVISTGSAGFIKPVQAPVLPTRKMPPALPPKKEGNISSVKLKIPSLPEVRIVNKVNPVKLPPLPPRRDS
ncbi:hypothetical protein AQ505_08460 [Pedobacter sp. PACM 27299]|nr:hypothetical protein AQ505_08460 [Pedobacter sp. PACM 27299]